MEFRLLRYFLAVAREENITAAADVLHITQPTLSKQLKDLEDELGKTLFIRGKRKITLTEDGMFLRKKAEEIISLVEKTQAELTQAEDAIAGDIYIGAGETEAMKIIAETSIDLQKKYPKIHYHLFSGNSDDIIERLDKGIIDFGILIAPSFIKKYNFIKLPVYDTWGLLMKKDHPLAKLDYITPKDLQGIPLLSPRQALANNEFTGWLGENHEELDIVATYNLIFNAAFLVEGGFGCALTLDKLVPVSARSEFCFKPLYPALKAELVLVWKKYQILSKSSQKFLEALQKKIYEYS